MNEETGCWINLLCEEEFHNLNYSRMKYGDFGRSMFRVS